PDRESPDAASRVGLAPLPASLVLFDLLFERFGIFVVIVDRLVCRVGGGLGQRLGVFDVFLDALPVGLVVAVERLDRAVVPLGPLFHASLLARILGSDAIDRRGYQRLILWFSLHGTFF